MTGTSVLDRGMRKSAVHFVAVAAFALLWSSRPAAAQIVNVQSAMSSQTKEGATLAVSGSAKWFTGNIDLLFLSGAPMVTLRSGRHVVLAFGKLDFATSNDDRVIFRTYEHVRYRLRLNRVLTPEVFVQHAFDQFIRLNRRMLAGIGPSFRVLEIPALSINAGVSYMIENERLSRKDDDLGNPLLDSGLSYTNHRASSYLMATYKLDKRVALIGALYFQPRLDRPQDLRILSDSSISVSLTTRLSFSTSLVMAYDSAPPATIKKLDTQMVSSLTVAL